MPILLATIEQEIKRRHLEDWYIKDTINKYADAFVICGYCSINIVDREGQRITIPALKSAVAKFMQNPLYMNIQIFHSDCQVGIVLPEWVHPITGKIYKTEVDNTGWKIVCQLRGDIDLALKVREEVEKGNLRSFSVAGTAKNKQHIYDALNPHDDILDLELYEISLCVSGVNQLARFDVIYHT